MVGIIRVVGRKKRSTAAAAMYPHHVANSFASTLKVRSSRVLFDPIA